MHEYLFGYPVQPFTNVEKALLDSGELLFLGFNGCNWERTIMTTGAPGVYTASLGVQLVGNDFRAVVLNANQGVKGVGTTANPFSLDVPGLTDVTVPSLNMTFPVYNPATTTHQELTGTQFASLVTYNNPKKQGRMVATVDQSSGVTYSISGGAGYTVTGSLVSLGATATVFNDNPEIQVYLSGLLLRKATDVVRASATTFVLNFPTSIGDDLQVFGL